MGGGTGGAGGRRRGHAETREPSIAVLPFANLSADKENEYFSDGLAEEIINALTQHSRAQGDRAHVRVCVPRQGAGRPEDCSRRSDVRTVLEGSVRRAGDRIRVSAQLINAADGYHLWSERFDRELADVFAVQDEIAAAIASALQVKLGRSVGAAGALHSEPCRATRPISRAVHEGADVDA